jgi:transcriptional regulator with PAS, ATPase and Fis domain
MNRTYRLKHWANRGKQTKILAVFKEYRLTAKRIADHQWYLFFSENGFNKNHQVKDITSALSERYKQVCQYQVVGMLESYISNRKNDFINHVYNSSLTGQAKLELLYINKYGLWFRNNVKIPVFNNNGKKNITVLIQGETGTGKEVLAKYIHAVSHRKKQPFLAFNCGAFTETLLESELFGHEKGSFTGATGRKKGIFELAHHGTLFLDEIDSASPAIQVKLLRILETGEFLRVGGEELVKVDVRIITATNVDLQTKVEANLFREDLFYRLDVASLFIPPLRDRAGDVPLFVNYFLEKETTARGNPAKRFSAEALKIIKGYNWPGNIRELANTVAQSILLSNGPLVTAADLPSRIKKGYKKIIAAPPCAEEKGKSMAIKDEKAKDSPTALSAKNVTGYFDFHVQGDKLGHLLHQFEKTLMHNLNLRDGFALNNLQNSLREWSNYTVKKIIGKALEATYGNQAKAAELLNITPRALRYYFIEKPVKKELTKNRPPENKLE